MHHIGALEGRVLVVEVLHGPTCEGDIPLRRSYVLRRSVLHGPTCEGKIPLTGVSMPLMDARPAVVCQISFVRYLAPMQTGKTAPASWGACSNATNTANFCRL
jgi:hypothetical protein